MRPSRSGALARELVHAGLGVLVGTLADLVCGGVCLVDDAVALGLAGLHVLVVELLGHREHAGGVGGAGLRRGGEQARGAGYAASGGYGWRLAGAATAARQPRCQHVRRRRRALR